MFELLILLGVIVVLGVLGTVFVKYRTITAHLTELQQSNAQLEDRIARWKTHISTITSLNDLAWEAENYAQEASRRMQDLKDAVSQNPLNLPPDDSKRH